jgi:catechol 2,3-dioxygenase-like lactoylglutathione lyase family enzyme
MPDQPTFSGVHFFVRDMAATLAFYRRVGLTVSGDQGFAAAQLPGGLALAFGSYELTRGYDPGWRAPEGGGFRNALQFSLPSHEAVDAIYADLTGAGYAGHLAPFDAFWGSRYAEVEDPDGNLVGFQSPRDPALVSPPPEVPS